MILILQGVNMKEKHVAFIYDFDGTLAHGNIQEYNFIPALNMTSEEFWKEVDNLKINNNMENVLAYMYLMLKKAEENNMSVKKSSFIEYGKNIKFYPGVMHWFDRINSYASCLGITMHHYVVSSGIREMIEGTDIADKFERIYACSFLYNVDEIAKWPAVSVNYTNKTQFLYRINKGIYEVYDASINDKMLDKDKKIPFENMVYFGDGMTDVPCMKLVKDNGGHAISVYEENRELAKKLLDDGRVNYIAKTDYTEDSSLDKHIKEIIVEISKRIENE